MIYDAKIESRAEGEKRVCDYLESKGYYNCIDFGGVTKPWASKFVKAYVDLVTPKEWSEFFPNMYKDTPEIWDAKIHKGSVEGKIRNMVAIPKYDFAICSHLVEHLMDPARFVNTLRWVAKEGFIAVPSKYFELGRGRRFSDKGLQELGLSRNFRGGIPHRWIFTFRDRKLWAFPKLPFIEAMEFDWVTDGPQEPATMQLGFMWKHNVDVTIIDDTMFGHPNQKPVIDYYREELPKGL